MRPSKERTASHNHGYHPTVVAWGEQSPASALRLPSCDSRTDRKGKRPMRLRKHCSAWLGLAGACLFVIGCGSDVPDPESDSQAAAGQRSSGGAGAAAPAPAVAAAAAPAPAVAAADAPKRRRLLPLTPRQHRPRRRRNSPRGRVARRQRRCSRWRAAITRRRRVRLHRQPPGAARRALPPAALSSGLARRSRRVEADCRCQAAGRSRAVLAEG